MYKIYINETPLLFMNTQDVSPQMFNNREHLVTRYSGKAKTLLNYADMLEKGSNFFSVTLHSDNLNQLWTDFQGHYRLVEAAGGVVYNETNEALVIFRRGFWDLPKGKIDPGETKEQAALREIEEETGLKNVELGAFLGETYHTFIHRKAYRVLKKTYWYQMFSSDTELILQYEEDIEKGEWCKIGSFLSENRTVYKNIVEVLKMSVNQKEG